MRRMILALVTALTVVGAAAAATSGAHFTNGGDPVCTDIGLQLACTAEVAGLGNATVDVGLTAQGTALGVTCTSPGGNTAPGQNPALTVNPSGTQTIHNPKNGRAIVDVTTATPTVTPQQAGCPNKNWRTSISDVTFSSYTLTISQGGTVVFSCSGSFSGSSDGETDTPSC
jgi:hypothetical protein